jgi:hypothetical protein
LVKTNFAVDMNPDFAPYFSAGSNSAMTPTGRYHLNPDNPISSFLQEPVFAPRVSRAIDPYYFPRAFQTKITIRATSQSSALSLTRILRSYPKMMLQKDRFPPFIHPMCFPKTARFCQTDQVTASMSIVSRCWLNSSCTG